MRTKTNGELRITNVNENVTLTGWCSKKRDLGGVVFIDLRDRYGITQLIVNPDNNSTFDSAGFNVYRTFIQIFFSLVKIWLQSSLVIR